MSVGPDALLSTARAPSSICHEPGNGTPATRGGVRIHRVW